MRSPRLSVKKVVPAAPADLAVRDLLLPIGDGLGREATDHLERRHRLGHDGAGRDHRTAADAGAVEQHRAGGNPGVVLDHRAFAEGAEVHARRVVPAGDDQHVGADAAVVADLQAGAPVEQAVPADHRIVADRDVLDADDFSVPPHRRALAYLHSPRAQPGDAHPVDRDLVDEDVVELLPHAQAAVAQHGGRVLAGGRKADAALFAQGRVQRALGRVCQAALDVHIVDVGADAAARRGLLDDLLPRRQAQVGILQRRRVVPQAAGLVGQAVLQVDRVQTVGAQVVCSEVLKGTCFVAAGRASMTATPTSTRLPSTPATISRRAILSPLAA